MVASSSANAGLKQHLLETRDKFLNASQSIGQMRDDLKKLVPSSDKPYWRGNSSQEFTNFMNNTVSPYFDAIVNHMTYVGNAFNRWHDAIQVAEDKCANAEDITKVGGGDVTVVSVVQLPIAKLPIIYDSQGRAEYRTVGSPPGTPDPYANVDFTKLFPPPNNPSPNDVLDAWVAHAATNEAGKIVADLQDQDYYISGDLDKYTNAANSLTPISPDVNNFTSSSLKSLPSLVPPDSNNNNNNNNTDNNNSNNNNNNNTNNSGNPNGNSGGPGGTSDPPPPPPPPGDQTPPPASVPPPPPGDQTPPPASVPPPPPGDQTLPPASVPPPPGDQTPPPPPAPGTPGTPAPGTNPLDQRTLQATPEGKEALQIQQANKVTVIAGQPGAGTSFDPKTHTLTIDPNDPNPNGTFVRQMVYLDYLKQHKGNPNLVVRTAASCDAYVNAQLDKEAHAYAKEIEYRISAGKTSNDPLQTAFQNAADAFKAQNPGATPDQIKAAGEKAIRAVIGNTQVPGVQTSETYTQFYGQDFDVQSGTAQGPSPMLTAQGILEAIATGKL